MNFAEHISQLQNELLTDHATKLIANLSDSIIRHLRGITWDSGMMQSPKSNGLKNLWDEICVQVQRDYSLYWDAYEDYIWSIVEELVRKLSKEEKLLIWMESDSFSDWADTFDADDDCDKAFSQVFPEGYENNAVIQTIYDDVISRASNYRNRRITTFLEQDYEF